MSLLSYNKAPFNKMHADSSFLPVATDKKNAGGLGAKSLERV